MEIIGGGGGGRIYNIYNTTRFGEGRMAEWLRYWTLNHEIVGSSPAIH